MALFCKKLQENFLLIILGMMLAGSIPGFSQKINLSDSAVVLKDTIPHELDEVVITATRVSKRIIDIPYSVVRINYNGIKFDRKLGSDDMLSSVPGLFLQSRYGDHDVRFSIRGFGSRSNSGVRGIRILLDDIPESEPDGQTRLEALDFNSIGRIEIVKGNASSLYTNAPGGVANFINDMDFNRSSVVQFNQFGSFGLHKNGFKAAVKTDKYRLLTTYSYVNYDGYRKHNNEYWHILNMVLETNPSEHTKLSILGYFVDGTIRLPGSLKKNEFEKDPYQACPSSVERDEKRITTKGRIGIRYNAVFGGRLNNEIEVTTYGTIKFFHRTAADYRIINRYGLGVSGRYINKSMLGNRHNEFSVGGDIFTQPARTEYYQNIHGSKGDAIEQIERENITNKGLYISENFEILREKMFALLTGRFDYVTYKQEEETLPARNDDKGYRAFTPKLALNYKLTPLIALYTSIGSSFDAPAANEMGSADPEYLFNRDLKPQESQNFEIGIKGNNYRWAKDFFRRLTWEATFYNIRINNEIIPYEVLGNVYYRNAAKTNRLGLELGAQLEIYRGLDFGLTYTYCHFTYLAYEAETIEQDSLLNWITSYRDFKGNIVPSVPEHNLYMSLSYTHPIGKHISFFIRSSYQGISGLWVDDENTDKTKAYGLLNGLLGLDMKFGKFNVMLSGGVNNIFDEVYVGFTNTNSANKRFYEAGAPRDYYGSVNFGYTF